MTLRTTKQRKGGGGGAGNIKNKSLSMISVLAQPNTAAIRTQEFAGTEHTVIPVVMLVEGVLWPGNSDVPELALAEEFGRFPEGWNGRPVVLDHPKVNGQPVSATSPNILEQYAIGQIFNTRLDGKKLVAEMWINNERVKELGETAERELERLQSEDSMVEVSTGLFSMLEMNPGVYNGEKYEAIWRDIVPDHLAILPEGVIGACSVEKGCGAPRLNASKKGQKLEDLVAVRFNVEAPVIRTEKSGSCECADKTSCKCENKQGLIDTEGKLVENKGVFDALRTRVKNLFKFESFRENQELVLSDDDIRIAITAAMRAADMDFFWVVAVFQGNNDSGTFVYESWSDYNLYAQDFSIKSDGTVVLSGDRVQVRPETRFVPVKVEAGEGTGLTTQSSGNSQEVTHVDKEKLVQDLISNTQTQFTDEDREWLMTLESTQLEKLIPKPVQAGTEEEEEQEQETPPTQNSRTTASEKPKPITLSEYIANAPAEMQEVLKSGLKMHQQRKNALIASLIGNARNKFSKEYLEKQDIETLENLVALANVQPDYTGAGAVLRDQDSNDDQPEAPPELFPIKQAS